MIIRYIPNVYNNLNYYAENILITFSFLYIYVGNILIYLHEILIFIRR